MKPVIFRCLGAMEMAGSAIGLADGLNAGSGAQFEKAGGINSTLFNIIIYIYIYMICIYYIIIINYI